MITERDVGVRSIRAESDLGQATLIRYRYATRGIGMEIVFQSIIDSIAVGVGRPAANVLVVKLRRGEVCVLPLREGRRLRKNRDRIEHDIGRVVIAYQVHELHGRGAAVGHEREVVMLKRYL